MFIAEVVETKMAYKPNQKDEQGNPLPLGSIQIRIGSHQSNLGQVRNVYARPAYFNKRIPLIGEMILVVNGPVNDWSTSANKGTGFMYFSALNTTDDLTLHTFPKLWKRKGLVSSGGAGERKSDKEEPGYSFPKNPKKVFNIQPFEGDDIYEGRFGQSIRFGSTVDGDTSIYEKKPTWKGGTNGDPLLILRIKKPDGGGQNKYIIEDLNEDQSSIYLTSTQKLQSLKPGFDKNQDVKQASNWAAGSQILLDSDRLVLNAKKNILFLIGKEKAVVTGKKVVFQSDKYKVDLDELIDFLKKWLDEDKALASGQAQYSTASGPTAVATNMAKYITLSTSDFQKFKMP